jgi:branched-chain amino acid transport system ATP-binding protein
MNGLLVVRDYTVRRGATPVAGPLSLDVREGEVLVLVGRNGSGKSSFLSGLAGVLVSGGTLVLGGRDISKERPRERLLAGLALCPSERHLFADLPVRENVLLGAYTSGRREAQRRFAELQERPHFRLLGDRSRQRAGTLSGGQQQIVALARALMSRPRLLLLDEPTAGLAPEAREQVGEIVRDFASRDGHGVILAEENLEFACSIGSRLVAFLGGRMLFDTTERDRFTPADVLQKLLEGEAHSAAPTGGSNAS